jgi:hypothetical protein
MTDFLSDGLSSCETHQPPPKDFTKRSTSSAGPARPDPHGLCLAVGHRKNIVRHIDLLCCVAVKPSNARLPTQTTTMALAITTASKFWLKSGVVRSPGVRVGTK